MEEIKRFRSLVNKNAGEFKKNYEAMSDLVDELNKKLEESRWEGKKEHTERYRKSGRLLARERIELLLDEDSPFLELLALAGNGKDGSTSGASLVSGIGLVCGIECMITSNVYTIKGGTMNEASLFKSARIAEISMENRLPSISLIQSVYFSSSFPFPSPSPPLSPSISLIPSVYFLLLSLSPSPSLLFPLFNLYILLLPSSFFPFPLSSPSPSLLFLLFNMYILPLFPFLPFPFPFPLLFPLSIWKLFFLFSPSPFPLPPSPSISLINLETLLPLFPFPLPLLFPLFNLYTLLLPHSSFLLPPFSFRS